MSDLPLYRTDYDENAAVRSRILRASRSERAGFRSLFEQDCSLFVDLCLWTYRLKVVDQMTGEEMPATVRNWPFILWPIQRKALGEIVAGIQRGEDVAIRKTRDMGASWLVLSAFLWSWLFHGKQLLCTSRVEDLVDRSGDPDCLFWKLDYQIANLPPWLLPASADDFAIGSKYRQRLMIRHPKSGATIAGASATPHVGRGGRRDATLFDELSAMEDAEAAWRSAEDTTACRIAVATPFGVGTHYASIVRQGYATGSPKIIELMYWDHPEKGRGAEERVDVDGRVTGVVGKRYAWTPWLESELPRRDRISLAQNVFAEEIGSGAAVFDSRAVTRMIAERARPGMPCEIVSRRMVQVDKGRWLAWDHDPEGLRRRSTGLFAFGIDPSYGTGSANASIVVMDIDRREQVAEFACPYTRPEDLALIAVEAARHVWTGRAATIIAYETNGPGSGLHHDFEAAGWRRLYRMRRIGYGIEERTERIGWTSSPQAKRALLALLSRSVTQGLVQIRSEPMLREMLEYVVLANGALDAQSRADLSTGAREAHGDRVIAGALAVMACDESHSDPDPAPAILPGTMGELMRMDELFEE